MPRAKAKAKKDETPKEVKVVNTSTSEELFDALLKQDAEKANGTEKNNEKLHSDAEEPNVAQEESSKIPVKPANGNKGGGRGKKIEKPAENNEQDGEKEPVKKTASKGKGRKATAADVEVTAKETENIETNGGEVDNESEVKQETVVKSSGRTGGSRGKKGAKAVAEIPVEQNGGQENDMENGISEETENQEVIETKPKGRGGKKTAKTVKEPIQTESPKENSVADKKVEDVKTSAKTGGRKKKVDETKETVSTSQKDTENGINGEEDLNIEPNPPKKRGRAATKKPAAKIENDQEEPPKAETELPEKKPSKRGAKASAKVNNDMPKTEEIPKEEPEIPAKKATKRAAAKEAVKEKADVEKVPAKKARGGAKVNNKIEENTEDHSNEKSEPIEEPPTKKRSRKEPSVEKELKPQEEKPKKGRGGKRKAEKADTNEDVEVKQEKKEDEVVAQETSVPDTNNEEKPTSSRGGRKRAAPSTKKTKKANADEKVDDEKVTNAVAGIEDNDDDENDEADGSKPSKAKKKKEPARMNSTSTIYNKADFELPPLADGQTSDEPRFNLKISSWNVAGLRSWVKKDGLKFLEYEEPDIFCLQETKCVTDQLPDEVQRIPGYHPYWLCMPGGYAGVAIYSKIMPINVEYGIGNKEFDDVGRIITAEYEKFFLVNVYVPNSGRKLVNLESRMKWEKLFQEFVQKLNERKPLVICGDMNVSHQEIDLSNPKTNTKNAGFTKEERDKMTELLGLGYVDTFRHLYPDRKGAYTFWTYMGNARSRNVGWRLDYFLVSERFIKRVVDNCIRSQCMGSDHCPITLFLKL
ncbi:recombination repair protein 1 [Haematobia irritans]|uniref:recombination repair protein 1 n=1 Tax=Haematobia irritans TaxID=7368 RepID=UPI003F4F7ADD